MQRRFQYSLALLLVLILIAAAVMAFIVLPWRHAEEQERIAQEQEKHAREQVVLWQELHTFEQLKFLPQASAAYRVIIESNNGELPKGLIEKLNACERIESLYLNIQNKYKGGTDFKKIQGLKKLEEIEYRAFVGVCEQEFVDLAALSLKSLAIDCYEPTFQNWPISPSLQYFSFQSNRGSVPPLVLKNHAKLNHVKIKMICNNSSDSVHIETCPQLTHLEIATNDSRISNCAPNQAERELKIKLFDLPNLKELQLTNRRQHPVSAELAQLPALESASFIRFSPNVLPMTPEMRLQTLVLVEPLQPLSPTDWNGIFACAKLRELVLGIPSEDYPEAAIPKLPPLQRLHLNAGNSNHAVPARFAKRIFEQANGLESCSLFVEIADEELLRLLSKQKLTSLNLRVNQTLETLGPLEQCQQLEELIIQTPLVYETQVARLASLPLLKKLNITHCRQTDDLAKLFENTNLKSLHLNSEKKGGVIKYYER